MALNAAVEGGDDLGLGVGLAAVALILQQLLTPLRIWLGEEVMRQVDAYSSRQLISAVGAVSDLRLLEQPQVISDVRDASESLAQASSTPGDAVAGGLGLISRYVTLTATVLLLSLVSSPLLGAGGLVIALLNRQGQTIGLSQWSAIVRRRSPARRRLTYVRQVSTEPLLARDVRQLRLSDWLADRYRSESRQYLRPLWWARRRLLGRRFLGYAAATLILGTCLFWFGASQAISSNASVGTIAIWLQTAIACLLFGTMFPESDPRMQYGLAAWYAIESVESALSDGKSTSRSSKTYSDRQTPSLPSSPAGIVMRGIGYEYSGGIPVLDGLDLELPRGLATALVGVNGAGKSTLVKILAGLYRPSRGSVIIDGIELTSALTEQWQGRIAILHQDFMTYQLSIRDNVVMQSVALDDDEEIIRSCLRDVGLQGLPARHPTGLDTPLSRLMPNGTDLSGGQWQRLALARALYAVRTGARLLVLDEPTSQLDARGEAEFYDKFLSLTHGVTSLVISHRFSSVRRAHSIAVLEGGQVSEFGNHHELVEHNGVYARMFTAQATRYGL
jgi:ATP-binding cassette subfamily B protein